MGVNNRMLVTLKCGGVRSLAVHLNAGFSHIHEKFWTNFQVCTSNVQLYHFALDGAAQALSISH